MEEQYEREYSDLGRELRRHGTPELPAACYSGSLKEKPVPLHWHGELEVGFVTEGNVVLTAGKEKRVLTQGDGFFINSGILHAFHPGDGASCRQKSLVFDPSLVGGRYDSLFWQKYVEPVISAASTPWLVLDQRVPWQNEAISFAKKAWDVCQEGELGFELDLRQDLSRLMGLLSSHLPQEQPGDARRISRDNERIRTMLQFIQAHFGENITAGDIAASALISTSEALRCFHNTIGMTPVQYMKSYRVQLAAELLRSTDRRISDIAAQCGFQEMSYFAKAFRTQMGMTPGAYREHKKPNLSGGSE